MNRSWSYVHAMLTARWWPEWRVCWCISPISERQAQTFSHVKTIIKKGHGVTMLRWLKLLYLCLSLSVSCVSVCVFKCNVYMYNRLVSFFGHHLSCILNKGFSASLEAMLTGQQATQICLLLFPQCWIISMRHHTQTFIWMSSRGQLLMIIVQAFSLLISYPSTYWGNCLILSLYLFLSP